MSAVAPTANAPPLSKPEVRRNKDGKPVDANGKPLRPCCVCLDTKGKRDECIINRGEENCKDFIEAHKQCMRDLGFNI